MTGSSRGTSTPDSKQRRLSVVPDTTADDVTPRLDDLGPEAAIFPRNRPHVSEFQRMRRPIAEYRAAERRARKQYGLDAAPARVVHVRAIGPSTVEIDGGYPVRDVLQATGVRYMPAPKVRGTWHIQQVSAEKAFRGLEDAGYTLELTL